MQTHEIVILILISIAAVLTLIYLVIHQRKKVIEWLKWVTLEAEKELGTKTGQAKLHLVYSWFCKQFPKLASVIRFKWFSGWVDIALDTMREWLEKNSEVADYVKNRK